MGSFSKSFKKLVAKIVNPGAVKAATREKRALRTIAATDAVERQQQLDSIPPPPAWVIAPSLPTNGGSPASADLATSNNAALTAVMRDQLAAQENAIAALELDAQSGAINTLREQRAARSLTTAALVGVALVGGVIFYIWGRR